MSIKAGTAYWHIHDKDDKHVGDICGGTGRYYVARARFTGYRKYKVLSSHSTYAAAIKAMTKGFANNGAYKRADVLLCADYYDPIQLCELVRR